MTNRDNDYDALKVICKAQECFCPNKSQIYHQEAITPLHMKLWLGIRYGARDKNESEKVLQWIYRLK